MLDWIVNINLWKWEFMKLNLLGFDIILLFMDMIFCGLDR